MTTVIVQNVVEEIREPITNTHKCGFCRECGHNISQCNNGRIVEIDNKLKSLLDICKREKNDIRLYNSVKLLKVKETQKIWLSYSLASVCALKSCSPIFEAAQK